MLITPYYTTIADPKAQTCHPDVIRNHKPYDLFSLRTKIVPYIRHKLHNVTLDIRFGSYEDEGRLNTTIVPIDGGTDIKLKKVPKDILQDIQARINFETSQRVDYCLIYSSKLSQLPYNKAWITNMLTIVDVPNSYYGSYEIENGYGHLYLNLVTSEVYSDDYNEILESIENQLIMMYNNGYVYGAQDIADDWDLERVDSEDITQLGIYKPNWTNKFITDDLVYFLQHLIAHPQSVMYTIPNGDNYVARFFMAHSVVNKFKELTFDGNNVFISPIKNIAEARKWCTILHEACAMTGKVVTMRSNLSPITNHYLNIMNNILPYHGDYRPITYVDEDVENPYVASGLIDEYQNISNIQEQILDDDTIYGPPLLTIGN